MDAYVYRYKNKFWNFAPDWLFKLFHKPQIFKNCKLESIQLDDAIPADNAVKITIIFDEQDDIKIGRKSDGRTES